MELFVLIMYSHTQYKGFIVTIQYNECLRKFELSLAARIQLDEHFYGLYKPTIYALSTTTEY